MVVCDKPSVPVLAMQTMQRHYLLHLRSETEYCDEHVYVSLSTSISTLLIFKKFLHMLMFLLFFTVP